MDAELLRRARFDKGLTLREAAAGMGVNWKTLQRIEAAQSSPFPRTAKRIADFYGMRVTDFMPLPTPTSREAA